MFQNLAVLCESLAKCLRNCPSETLNSLLRISYNTDLVYFLQTTTKQRAFPMSWARQGKPDYSRERSRGGPGRRHAPLDGPATKGLIGPGHNGKFRKRVPIPVPDPRLPRPGAGYLATRARCRISGYPGPVPAIRPGQPGRPGPARPGPARTKSIY